MALFFDSCLRKYILPCILIDGLRGASWLLRVSVSFCEKEVNLERYEC